MGEVTSKHCAVWILFSWLDILRAGYLTVGIADQQHAFCLLPVLHQEEWGRYRFERCHAAHCQGAVEPRVQGMC